MYKYPRRDEENWDKRDGLKVNRVLAHGTVSRHCTTISVFDVDNIVMSSFNGFHRVSIAKQLKKLNRSKCRKLNKYNGKLNGRDHV